jgi:hypothetical protein|tara:strand:- start:378 stop:611 length:234 start_codon:yes stop_codon:yes gene_type:complete
MEYIVIRRTKLYKSDDMLSIEKTAKTLDEAVKFKVALEMLDSGENKSYHILIDTHDAFAYISTEKLEEDKDKVVNIK